MFLGAGVLLVLLDIVIYNLKMTHSLGVEEDKLLKSIIRVDFRHG